MPATWSELLEVAVQLNSSSALCLPISWGCGARALLTAIWGSSVLTLGESQLRQTWKDSMYISGLKKTESWGSLVLTLAWVCIHVWAGWGFVAQILVYRGQRQVLIWRFIILHGMGC